MKVNYRISLWNYFHYIHRLSLEQVIDEVRRAGYGIELWPGWFEDRDLYAPLCRERLRVLVAEMPCSLHTGGAKDIHGHQKQIDCAAHIGADVIVIHPGDVADPHGNPDPALAREAVAYAGEKGVTLALENGPLWFLEETIVAVDGLQICIDTGHLYHSAATRDGRKAGMAEYVNALKPRLAHLHLQDPLPKSDHYAIGTGMIPDEDWGCLLAGLEEIHFDGAAVLEVLPRTPLQLAEQSFGHLAGLGWPGPQKLSP